MFLIKHTKVCIKFMKKDFEERKDYFLNKGFDSYVFFTLSNKEEELAEELNKKYDDIYCLVLKKIVHRSINGQKFDEEDVMIKGYVFVYVDIDRDIAEYKSDNHFYRILNLKMDKGRLFGSDYVYSKWVLEQNGFIGLSKAIKVNEKVKIVSGPLSMLEGYIVEYSKRNRNCCVETKFLGKTIKMWLPFDWLDQSYKM